jgi:hypothetical protein
MAAWRKSGILLYLKVDGSMEKKWDTVILEGRWQHGEKVGFCYT